MTDGIRSDTQPICDAVRYMLSCRFDPSATIIDSIALNDEAGIARLAKKNGLRFLSIFLRDLNDRLSRDKDSEGRQYQREIISEFALHIVSPFSGERVRCSRSIAVNGRVFYHFQEAVDYFVASSAIRLGYPLTALFLPQANRVLSWEGKRNIRSVLKGLSESFGSPRNNDSDISPARVVVLMGHKNFAHHLWNELSALNALLVGGPPTTSPQLILAREPLGAIDKIFPEIKGWKIRRLTGSRQLSANNASRLYVNLAGFNISAGLRARVVRHALVCATPKTRQLISRIRDLNAPVFWISVRMFVPTFTNQREVMAAIATRLLENYPSCAILFDGFSLPEDWANTDTEMQRFYQNAVEAERSEIEAIMAELRRQRPPGDGQIVANVGGLGILDSIALAQVAHTYFCHKGSIQHKIGWTANPPGIIHGPRHVLENDPADWHASPLHDAIKPVAIDARMVEAATTDKQSNYRAVDCAELTSFVLDQFRKFLPGLNDSRLS
jgi:hypothetical protein